MPREAHLRFEPVDERDDVGVLKGLEHLKLIVDHVFISTNVLLEDDLDCHLLAVGGVSLANDTVCACTQCSSELVERPSNTDQKLVDHYQSKYRNRSLFLIALRLSRQLVEHICD